MSRRQKKRPPEIPPWEEEFNSKAGDALPLLNQVRDIARSDSALERDLTRDELAVRLELARRLLDETPPEALQDAWMVLDPGYSMDMDPWLHDLPHALAGAGLIDPAVDLGRRLSEAFPGEGFETDVVRVLAEAGRGGEAIQSAVKLMDGRCTAPDRLAAVGEIMAVIGEAEKAFILYRQASLLEDDPRQRRAYLDLEIPLLRRLGRVGEANAIEAILPALDRFPSGEDASPSDDFWALDPVDPPPKPRRNDPCPCGSGKKYKKCCGQEAGI